MLTTAEQLVGLGPAEASAGCAMTNGCAGALQGVKAVTASTKKVLTSVYRGVCWNRKNCRWQASLNNTGRYIYLGSYKTQEEAAAVFDRAALRLRGARARLNFSRSNYLDGLSGELLPDPEMDRLLAESAHPELKPNKRARTMPSATAGMQPGALPQILQRSSAPLQHQLGGLGVETSVLPHALAVQTGVMMPHTPTVSQGQHLSLSPQLQSGVPNSPLQQCTTTHAATSDLDDPAHNYAGASRVACQDVNAGAMHVDAPDTAVYPAAGQQTSLLEDISNPYPAQLSLPWEPLSATAYNLHTGIALPDMPMLSASQMGINQPVLPAFPTDQALLPSSMAPPPISTTACGPASSIEQQQQQQQQQVVAAVPHATVAAGTPSGTPTAAAGQVNATPTSTSGTFVPAGSALAFSDSTTAVQAAHRSMRVLVRTADGQLKAVEMVLPASSSQVASSCSAVGASVTHKPDAVPSPTVVAQGHSMFTFNSLPQLAVQQLPAAQWVAPSAAPQQGDTVVQQQGSGSTMVQVMGQFPSMQPVSNTVTQQCVAAAQPRVVQLPNGQHMVVMVAQPTQLQQASCLVPQPVLLQPAAVSAYPQQVQFVQFAKVDGQQICLPALPQPVNTNKLAAVSINKLAASMLSHSSMQQHVANQAPADGAPHRLGGTAHSSVQDHPRTSPAPQLHSAPPVSAVSISPGRSMVDSNHLILNHHWQQGSSTTEAPAACGREASALCTAAIKSEQAAVTEASCVQPHTSTAHGSPKSSQPSASAGTGVITGTVVWEKPTIPPQVANAAGTCLSHPAGPHRMVLKVPQSWLESGGHLQLQLDGGKLSITNLARHIACQAAASGNVRATAGTESAVTQLVASS